MNDGVKSFLGGAIATVLCVVVLVGVVLLCAVVVKHWA